MEAGATSKCLRSQAWLATTGNTAVANFDVSNGFHLSQALELLKMERPTFT